MLFDRIKQFFSSEKSYLTPVSEEILREKLPTMQISLFWFDYSAREHGTSVLFELSNGSNRSRAFSFTLTPYSSNGNSYIYLQANAPSMLPIAYLLVCIVVLILFLHITVQCILDQKYALIAVVFFMLSIFLAATTGLWRFSAYLIRERFMRKAMNQLT